MHVRMGTGELHVDPAVIARGAAEPVVYLSVSVADDGARQKLVADPVVQTHMTGEHFPVHGESLLRAALERVHVPTHAPQRPTARCPVAAAAERHFERTAPEQVAQVGQQIQVQPPGRDPCRLRRLPGQPVLAVNVDADEVKR
ncbi:MAG: hypothetical protein F4053_01730, partial [Proteobacteria bacterium]|nr:hypothetical protein [Pseudomonadota bacterium]